MKVTGVDSRTTIYRWANQIMTEKEVLARKLRKGHQRLLSEEEESIVAGAVLAHAEVNLDTSKNFIIQFVNELKGISVTDSWVRHFAARNDLTCRQAKGKENVPDIDKDYKRMVEFLKGVRARNKRPSQICCLDKTSIYSDAIYRPQYAAKNR